MRARRNAAIALLMLMAALRAGADDGPVIQYVFDEGEGSVVRDHSGNGFDATVAGPVEWVDEGPRKVLRFGGDTHLDVGTQANALMGAQGTLETWALPEEIRGGLISWHTGSYWRDERLVLSYMTYQDSRVLGVLADGVDSNLSLREVVERGKWCHLALTFDGNVLRLFINGEERAAAVQTVSPNLEGVPLRIGLSDGLGHARFLGRMAEARIYNRALSADELIARYREGVQQLGIALPSVVSLATRFDARQAELTATCGTAGVKEFPARGRVRCVLQDAQGNVIAEKTAPVRDEGDAVEVSFPTRDLAAGLYKVSAVAENADNGEAVSETALMQWYLPEVAQVAGTPPGRKVLNNLVTQLVWLENLQAGEDRNVVFVNPRDGWVFVSATAQVGAGASVSIGLDGAEDEPVIAHQPGAGSTQETMRLLDAGEHTLRVRAQAGADGQLPSVSRLVVRAIPAIMYCGWPGSAHAGYGEYGFDFLEQDVLPNMNTFVGGASPAFDTQRAEWVKRGGKCMLEQNLPTVFRATRNDIPNPLTGDYAYEYWTTSDGFTRPNMSGVVADEFSGGDHPDFYGYMDAIKRIAANPDFDGKAVHMWCASTMYVPSLGLDFVRTVIDSGYKIATEVYLSEPPTVDGADQLLKSRISDEMSRWQQAIPGFQRHAIFVLGVLSAPPETCNLNPQVDYKVFLDMQFQHLATSPECPGLWGLMIYKATYAEEEALRWSGRLFRHYCIEGNTDLLSEQYDFTYGLQHIRNADFTQGQEGWQFEPAERGSISTGHMRGLHDLFGRYGGAAEGNDFLLMKRCAGAPNHVSQDVVGLTPGRLYSMKMFVADHADLMGAVSEQKRLAVSVTIDDAEMIGAKSFVSDIRSIKPVAQYAGRTGPWMNHHRLVFRAKAPTARLTISDWVDGTTPGGPVGQEILCNFIEVQPYLED